MTAVHAADSIGPSRRLAICLARPALHSPETCHVAPLRNECVSIRPIDGVPYCSLVAPPTRRPVGGATGLQYAQAEKIPPTSSQATHIPHVEQSGNRFYLDGSMPVEKAPSIGAKTADAMARHGIKTVGDLLASDPDKLAASLNDRHIDAYTILTWQMQADLCCDVPHLRGHDAQFLTACGISHRAELATADPAALLKKIDSFVATPAGERILRGSERLDLAEVTYWIRWANRPEQSKAA